MTGDPDSDLLDRVPTPAPQPRSSTKELPVFVFAHLSDTHLDDTPESAARTARVLDYLHALARPVDAILITGDVADHGLEDEYRLAAKLFASPLPVLVCPGNHDVREAYRKGLRSTPGTTWPARSSCSAIPASPAPTRAGSTPRRWPGSPRSSPRSRRRRRSSSPSTTRR
jgi:hypothetical protein